MSKITPWLLQSLSLLCGAASAVMAKAALQSLPTVVFMLLFATSSVLIVLPWLNLSKLRHVLRCTAGIALTVTNLAAMFMFYLGLKGLTPATHAFLSRAQVVFGFLLARWLFQERYSTAHWWVVMVAVLSILMTYWPGIYDVMQLQASLYTLLAALLFAVNYAQLRMFSTTIEPAVAIFIYNLPIVAVMLIYLRPTTPEMLLMHPLEASLSVGSALFSSMSLAFYILSVGRLSFFYTNALRATGPFWVALIAQPFYPASPTWPVIAGAILLTIALISMTWLERH